MRETQTTAQRLETHLKQKEKLYEDKIKVRFINMYTQSYTQTHWFDIKHHAEMS